MAKRRMFSKEITESDAFLNMPLSAQALYFHLGMEADDDGVVNNFNTTARKVGANTDDIRILLARRFILAIEEEGIIVIKHWKINNIIQKDRYTQSNYQEALKLLDLDDKKAYFFKQVNLLDESNKAECIQNVSTDKVSIGKVSIGKDNNKMELDNQELVRIAHLDIYD